MHICGQGLANPFAAEESVLHPARVMRCRVDGITGLNHDMRELRLTIEAGGPFAFSAGQYAQIELAPGQVRFFSMASTPAEEQLVFLLRRMSAGNSDLRAAPEAAVGDTVKVCGPFGTAYLRDERAGPVLLLAGGSGLAPMLSILRTLLGRGNGERIALYFGVRNERDVYHENLLADLASAHSNFSYHIVLSEPGGACVRRSGLVHQAVADDLADAFGYKAYLAGPLPMVAAASEMLLGKGAAPQDIHADAIGRQTAER